MYEQGLGVNKDPKHACELYKLAADQGHHHAQYNLGLKYAKGEGVTQSVVGDQVTVTCLTNYHIAGTTNTVGTTTCGNDQIFTSVPSCIPDPTCGDIDGGDSADTNTFIPASCNGNARVLGICPPTDTKQLSTFSASYISRILSFESSSK